MMVGNGKIARNIKHISYLDSEDTERLQLQAQASELIASGLDYEQTVNNIADLLVTSLATWCSIDLVDDQGKIQRVAISHKSPYSKVVLTKENLKKYPPTPNASNGVLKVIASGKPVLYSTFLDSIQLRESANDQHFNIIKEIGASSYMCVPLKARGVVIGAIMLLSDERAYNFKDLETTIKLARTIALAVDNVKMFRRMGEAIKIRDEFLATLSHELRTPINVIQGWVKILKDEKLDESSYRGALKILERNSKLQASLISDLLDVSRIVSGKYSLHKKRVNLTEIVLASLDAMSISAQEKSITILKEISEDHIFVFGDSSNLQRMFLNLITNALKFTPNNGQIIVKLYIQNNMVHLNVIDNGKGIESQFLPFIFDSFRQEDSSSSRAHNGLGLGLSIVKKIVELHNGHIQVCSNGRGLGSEFNVTLPLKNDQNRIQLVSNNSKQDDSRGQLQGVNVLIVDDSDDVRFLLSRYLKQSGANVVDVNSAKLGFESLIANKPNILICDIGMPDEDGYSLIRRIRQLPPAEGGMTKSVALTAYADVKSKKRILKSGFDLYLNKPINQVDLVSGLKKLLS